MQKFSSIVRLINVLARKIWPDLDELPQPDRQQLKMELFSVLFGLPWVLVSLGWLVAITDWSLFARQWPALALLLSLGFLLGQISFFQIIPGTAGRYSYNSSNLSGVILLAALFLFGPSAIWLQVVHFVLYYASLWPQLVGRLPPWTWFRNLIFNFGPGVLAMLVTSAIYLESGGTYPLEGGDLRAAGAALLAFLIVMPINTFYLLVWGIALTILDLRPRALREDLRRFGVQTLLFWLLSDAPSAFGILLAAVYGSLGLGAFLFAMAGMVLVSLLARSLSQALMASQARSKELDRLEQLGRAIIAGPPDAATLPQLLAEYVPQMLIFRQIEIRLFDGTGLLSFPPDLPPLDSGLWAWLAETPSSALFDPEAPLPWRADPLPFRIYLNPIRDAQTDEVLGGICLVMEVETFLQIPADQMPALQVLADQIASALYGARVYAQTLEHQKVAQELAFAGQIQASFLPEEVPAVEGWDLVATLLPARETSGDFYDFIPLEEGALGIAVGDVADKGVGAALFMALSRTLIRTYALQYPREPARALLDANRRILQDAQAGLFVTLFYAVLDPVRGLLTYANAGHNPPFLLDDQPGGEVLRLTRTGVPLGLFEEQTWTQQSVRIPEGGLVVLYSDGLTEALDAQGEMFGETRLQECLLDLNGKSAGEVQAGILHALRTFAGSGPPSDDLTLLVLRREHSG